MWAAATAAHAGTLYLYGGQSYGGRSGDLWRLDLSTGGVIDTTRCWKVVRACCASPIEGS